MKPEGAIEMMPACDLSSIALEDAVLRLGPARTYELVVAERDVLEAKNMLRKIAAQSIDNPFSPYVNLVVNAGFRYSEWSLSANGKIVWSPGA